MKPLWILFLVLAAAHQGQAAEGGSTKELEELGFSYPLSSDWVLATTLMRKAAEEQNPPPTGSVVLAAVYVPENRNLTGSSPFFSLIAFNNVRPDCNQFLGEMVSQLKERRGARVKSGPTHFSMGSNDLYRADFEEKGPLKHRALICATAKQHLLVWNASARDEKGIEEIASTLSSFIPASAVPKAEMAAAPTSSSPPQEGQASGRPEVVRVTSGITTGLVMKKVPPVYPPEARAAYIQGTILLNAIISTEGNIISLELISGPIELAGSAVHAVRQWKYRPYMLNGKPVAIQTQIQVNYTLR